MKNETAAEVEFCRFINENLKDNLNGELMKDSLFFVNIKFKRKNILKR